MEANSVPSVLDCERVYSWMEELTFLPCDSVEKMPHGLTTQQTRQQVYHTLHTLLIITDAQIYKS